MILVRTIIIVSITLLIAGCVSYSDVDASATSTDLSFLTPEPTPSTAAGRYNAYWKDMNISLARLKRDVERIEANKQNSPDAFFWGLSVWQTMYGLKQQSIPTDADLLELGESPGLAAQHEEFMYNLEACRITGEIGMNFESFSLKELLTMNTECKNTISEFEKIERARLLFICPDNHPLCSDDY